MVASSSAPFLPPSTTPFSSSSLLQQNILFVSLFIFRYLRLLVHMISVRFLYKLAPIPAQPSIYPSDCTIIIPILLDPAHNASSNFTTNLESILLNHPAAVSIATVGKSNLARLQTLVQPLVKTYYPYTAITCSAIPGAAAANKRLQITHAAARVTTKLAVLTDDSVAYPSHDFLRVAIAPFEDAAVGCVGTHKRVVREQFFSSWWWQSFVNFLGCVYLERHNFETAATNALDGGVFVVSGRTLLIRTLILQDPAFVAEFTNERLFRSPFCSSIGGPLNADDDNFITRWLVRKRWKIKIQSNHIVTRLGTSSNSSSSSSHASSSRFFAQVLRWTRTTWRSNPRSLSFFHQPWTLYAVHISSLFNFALLIDGLLLTTFSPPPHPGYTYYYFCYGALCAWILGSKCIKLIPHLRRYPRDVVFLPGYVVFAYCHSFIKLYALLTFWDLAWSGRDLSVFDSEDNGYNDGSGGGGASGNVEKEKVNRKAKEKKRRPISTPWGLVSANINPASTPANVLEVSVRS